MEHTYFNIYTGIGRSIIAIFFRRFKSVAMEGVMWEEIAICANRFEYEEWIQLNLLPHNRIYSLKFQSVQKNALY